MTCLEKYMSEHQDEKPDDVVRHNCPNCDGGIDIDDPSYCTGDNSDLCRTCWNRQVPGTEPVNEERNVPMTKEQMLMEIKKAHATIHEMEDRLKNLERYKAYEELANEIKAIHTAFMNCGFSNEQAYDLIKTTFAATVPCVMKGLI